MNAMENEISMETSPLTQQLYSIDWAVRFDEFRQYDQSSYSDLHQLLANIQGLVESELSKDSSDLNDTRVLTARFNKAKSGSEEWHRLSILIHLKIINSALPKGLTATATLSAIQIMEHMWKVIEHTDTTTDSTPVRESKTNKSAAKSTSKPPVKEAVRAAVKAAPEPAPRKKPKQATTNKSAAKSNNKPAAKNTSNRKSEPKTENVVIKKLAAEAGLEDDDVLEARCYEVACSLADEYPEYTLTAIRVMTAEKLGVTRQFVENLDIKPARFKNG